MTAELAATIRGNVLKATDASYDEARRLWNGVIDKRPALIVRCLSAEDVVAAVGFARDHQLLLAVRGGGHNVAGNAVVDGGLVIDLSPMKSIRVDPERRTARVEPGVTLGELDGATQVFGLATPLGVVTRTGIAGLTLGGGMGWLRRKYGLSSDNLVSVDVVTADGRLLTASSAENADLFWAIRGGGGNFGVVTSFEYRLHPVGPEVMCCFVLYPGNRAQEVLQACADYLTGVPDDVSPLGVLGRVPHHPLFPEQWHGEQYVALLAVHPDADDGEQALRPLRELGEPIADLSGRMPYTEAQAILDEDYPDGWRYYWKSINVDGLSDAMIARLVEHAHAAPSHHSTIDVWYQGGAMSRVPARMSAFGDRSAPILLGIEANWEPQQGADAENDTANISWARNCVAEMGQFSSGGQYLNFPGFLEEGDAMVRDAFGDNYVRLVACKNRYDPTNLFRLNHNVKPSMMKLT